MHRWQVDATYVNLTDAGSNPIYGVRKQKRLPRNHLGGARFKLKRLNSFSTHFCEAFSFIFNNFLSFFIKKQAIITSNILSLLNLNNKPPIKAQVNEDAS